MSAVSKRQLTRGYMSSKNRGLRQADLDGEWRGDLLCEDAAWQGSLEAPRRRGLGTGAARGKSFPGPDGKGFPRLHAARGSSRRAHHHQRREDSFDREEAGPEVLSALYRVSRRAQGNGRAQAARDQAREASP